MKTILIYIYFSCVYLSVFGQNYWNNKYYFDRPAANSQGIIYDVITNKYLVSGAMIDTNGYTASYMQSLSEDGLQNQISILSGSDSIVYVFDPSDLIYNNGYYYVTGAVYYNSVPNSSRKGLLVKYNANLDTLFTRTYVGTGSYSDFIPRFQQVDNDSIFIVGGMAMNINHTLIDINGLLIIADSNGNELKRISYGGAVYMEEILDIQKSGNDWVCAAKKDHYLGKDSANNDIYDYRGMVLIYNKKGDLLKSYTTPEQDRWANSVVATKDGGYAFCGTKEIGILSNNLGQKVFLHKGYLEKISANMHRVWTITLSKIDTTLNTQLLKIIENIDGTLVAAGADVDEYSNRHVSGWIVKLSANGQVLWQRHHKAIQTPFEDHIFNDMCKAPDGGYALAGVAWDLSGQEPVGTNAWVCKTDSFGCLVPGCQTVGIAPSADIADHIKLYPNPAQSELYLYFHTEKQPTGTSFRIWDMQGQEMVANTPLLNSTTHILRVQDWAKGLYFVEVRDKEGNVYTEKFVKE